jgi:hypothetical protein
MKIGAVGENRTPTSFRPLEPESSASTSSATTAQGQNLSGPGCQGQGWDAENREADGTDGSSLASLPASGPETRHLFFQGAQGALPLVRELGGFAGLLGGLGQLPV